MGPLGLVLSGGGHHKRGGGRSPSPSGSAAAHALLLAASLRSDALPALPVHGLAQVSVGQRRPGLHPRRPGHPRQPQEAVSAPSAQQNRKPIPIQKLQKIRRDHQFQPGDACQAYSLSSAKKIRSQAAHAKSNGPWTIPCGVPRRDLRRNRLTGSIPDEISKLLNLQSL